MTLDRQPLDMHDETIHASVIGLEVHAQVLTRSKMFCPCSAAYAGAEPNTHVCAVCGGMPGALPVINARAVECTVLTALALHSTVPSGSKFDRKNYPYPDLPKGYQITQYDRPIGVGGWLDFEVGDRLQRCGITRVHLEEDTGKSIHSTTEGRDASLIDYNRSGVPLMEIVSEPELRSAAAAREYFATLRHILVYLGVSDGNLQEGSLRADVNVSLCGADGQWGTKVEIKNLNSFRAVERALEYEIGRQREVLLSGGMLEQETRGWLEDQEITVSQRTKEYAHDYRYFPEPDLPPLWLAPAYVEVLRAQLPEFARDRRDRLVREFALTPAVASVLTDDRDLVDFFEAAVQAVPGVDPIKIGNWIIGELLRLLKESSSTVSGIASKPASVGRLVEMVENGSLNNSAGKIVLGRIFESGEDPDEVAVALDLLQLSDDSALSQLIDDLFRTNPKLVGTYLAGKTNAFQAMLGQVMSASQGKANPQRVKELLLERLQERVESG